MRIIFPKYNLITFISTLFLFLFCASKVFTQQQDFIFQKITTQQGLSQNQIYCIYQDYNDLLWFGTQDGLNLYDGYNFKVYKHEPGNLNSLMDYAVNAICETDTGIFWIGTREGLNKFDLTTETFTPFVHQPENENSLVHNIIWFITKDDDKNLWIGTAGGLSKLDTQTEKFINYKSNKDDINTISNNFVTAVLQDSKGKIWIGNRKGLDYWDQEENKFYRNIIVPDEPNNIYSNGIISLAEHNNKIFVGTYDGIFETDLNINKNENKKFNIVYRDPSTKTGIRSFSNGSDGTLWIATTGAGLFLYSDDLKEIKKFRSSDVPRSISENYLLTVYEDQNKVLWIGTFNSGINKHSRFSEQFITYNLPQSKISKQSDRVIGPIMEDRKGNLWFGTESGLIVRINSFLKNNESITILNETSAFSKVSLKSEITSLMEDDDGDIWITTFGQGVFILHPSTNQLKNLKFSRDNQNSLSNNYTHNVFQSMDGSIWIGTGAGGLNKYDKQSNKFTHYSHNPDDSTSISSNEIMQIVEDDNGHLWLGTSNGGLNKFDPATGKSKVFLHIAGNLKSIASNRIQSLTIDSKGILWVGTFGGGLNRFIEEDESFNYYMIKDGLPSNIIHAIVEDKNGSIWVSTDQGISRFNPANEEFKNYDVYDGLQGNEFTSNSVFVNKETALIYFGGANGINIFNPSTIKENKRKPKIVITNFKLFNKNITIASSENEDSPLKKNILYADEITVPYSDNFISFEFASLDFNNPEKNQYAYKMEGFNKDWIYSGNQRFATYTNLDAGDYIFKVKASNSDGQWNNKGTLIKVTVLPPWWQTWWAYIIYVVAIILILYFLRQFELKRVQLRNELAIKDVEAKKLQEVDKLKSRFFANISHEFRTPLTLVLGLTEKLSKKSSDSETKKDYGVIKKNANRLLQLINQLLELSKLEAGNVKLNISKQDINKFLRRVAASFISMAEQKNIKIYLNNKLLSESSDEEPVYLYIDIENFETITYNLLSNAIKFTPVNNSIYVDVKPHLHFVDIKFTNTGIGISSEKIPFIFNRFYQVDETASREYEGTGIGLALVKELVELHNGEIIVNSIEGKETSFTIKIPVGKAHYDPLKISEVEPVIDDKTKTIPSEDIKLPDLPDELIEEKKEISENEIDSEIILIVEDNIDLRNYISDQLKIKYKIFEAEDGEKGVKLAGEIIPDLIVSDIMMPKMDGYELCKKIKTDIKTSHIPVILLTAKAAREDKLGGLQLGADDYLVKPFDPDELLIRVENLIKLRQQMREKFRSEMILKPRDIIVPSAEKKFLDSLTKILEEKISDEKFGVKEMCSSIGLSRAQLHRKIRAVCNQSTTEFIRNFRLQRAAELIKQNAGNMAEISYQVGFNSQAYFTKSFTELFGCSPGEYKSKTEN